MPNWRQAGRRRPEAPGIRLPFKCEVDGRRPMPSAEEAVKQGKSPGLHAVSPY